MHLIQIFLPVYGNTGEQVPASEFCAVRDELVARFKGITAYTRSPAHGLWQPGDGKTVRDDLVVYEVMAEELDRVWWHEYKLTLERRFRQQEIILRAQEFELLQ